MRLLRRWHRALGIVVAVPCLLWGFSGAVLSWKHWTSRTPAGNPAAVAGAHTPFAIDPAQALRAAARADPPAAMRWTWLLGAPRYEIEYRDALLVIDGLRPVLLPPADEALARRVALADSPPGAQVVAVAAQAGPTLVFRPPPRQAAYRVSLSNGDEVYVSRATGQVLAHVDGVYRLLRVSFFALHQWDLARAPGRHLSFVVLMGMAVVLMLSGASGLTLALQRRRPLPRGPGPRPPAPTKDQDHEGQGPA